MSTIGIEIQGSPLKGSIDVETMRNRLTTMRDRVQQEIDRTGGNPQMLDRVDKLNSQIDRLENLDGKVLTMSADRAQAELAKGMRYLSEGMQYLQNQGEGSSRESGTVSRWYDHLESVYRTIDRRG